MPFDPPSFSPSKLTVAFDVEAGSSTPAPLPVLERRYTLTHNDMTGSLLLTVGRTYCAPQLSGWYIRLLRDEVLAEWAIRECGSPQLHLFCHVSGQERWLAPPQLRNYIFKREMPLVLDTLAWAERDLLATQPQYAEARVFVHLKSNVQDLNCTVEWGQFGFRDSWRRTPSSILQRILGNLPGIPGVSAVGSGSIGRTDTAYGSNRSEVSDSSSSWRLRLLARLDDSVDEHDFVPLSALNDPYSELQEMRAELAGERGAASAAASAMSEFGRQASEDSLAAASAAEAGNLPLQQANAEIAAAAEESSSLSSSPLWLPLSRGVSDGGDASVASASSTGVCDSQGSVSLDDYQQHWWQQREESVDAVLSSSNGSSSSSQSEHSQRQSGAALCSDDVSSECSNSGGEAESGQQHLVSEIVSSSNNGSVSGGLDCGSSQGIRPQGAPTVSSRQPSSGGLEQHSSSRHSLSGNAHSWQSICAKWPSSSDGHAVVCSASYDEH